MDGYDFLNGQEDGLTSMQELTAPDSHPRLSDSSADDWASVQQQQQQQHKFNSPSAEDDFQFYQDFIKGSSSSNNNNTASNGTDSAPIPNLNESSPNGPGDPSNSHFFASPSSAFAAQDHSAASHPHSHPAAFHHQTFNSNPAAASPFVEASQYREHPQSTASSASFLTDNGWDDQDLMFTPLLSPAMTNATSAFSPAVSTSNLKSTADSSQTVPSHQDPFTPLTSPALRPQNGGTVNAANAHHGVAGHPQQPPPLQNQQLAALMGAVDMSQIANFQAQAAAAFVQGQRQILQSLGLGHLVESPAALAAILQQSAAVQQQQQQPHSASTPSSNAGDQSLPPPRDPAFKPAKGRGASRTSSKARPSPIMRPMNSSSGGQNGSTKSSAAASPQRPKRSAINTCIAAQVSHSQSAPPSATASPMFPPSVFSSSGPQPMSHLSLNESPSPIDLAAMFKSSPAAGSSSNSDSQPNSLTQHSSTSFGPITPSTLMNLPDDVSMLHGLSPALQSVPEQQNEDIALPASSSSSSEMSGRNRRAAPQRQDTVMAAPAEKRSASQKLSTKRSAYVQHPHQELPSAVFSGGSAIAITKHKGKAKAKHADPDDPTDKKQSHKNAEQRRRDSLKECFEELRHLLPHIPPEEDEEAPKRPGEGNIGGQRHVTFDPEHPNKGVSKVALLRKSNEYLRKLHGRIDRRDKAIEALRAKLAGVGLELDPSEVEALQGVSSLDTIDEEEFGAWPFPRPDSDEVSVTQSSLSRRSSRHNADSL